MGQTSAPPLPELRAGSLLRLRGVCALQSNERHEPETFRLLLSEPGEVAVLKGPPWWTPRLLVTTAGGLAVAIVAALGWVWLLRNQVHRQTETIRQNHSKLLGVSRQAGMAEVATSVLHNVGNVLNSVNVSSTLISEQLKTSKTGHVGLLAKLLAEHKHDLAQFLIEDPKGRHVPDFLEQLSTRLAKEQEALSREVELLKTNVGHIKEIVAMQQSYSKVAGVAEKVVPSELVEDALRMNESGLERHQVRVVREYEPHLPEITIERHKVLQILVNLIGNAKNACTESGFDDKRITLRVRNGGNTFRISVADNGVGIPAENLKRIFTLGFTTRKNGHGFGLHGAALAATELRGALRVHSDGAGKGATFTLELPVS